MPITQSKQDNEYLIFTSIPRFLGNYWSGSKWGSFNQAHRFPQEVKDSATLPHGLKWVNIEWINLR